MIGEAAGTGSGTQLVLIRHGETVWNTEGRYQGQFDPPLTPAGMRQAVVAARFLRRQGLSVIYSSPLVRALESARRIAQVVGTRVIIDDRLMEINLGRWQGQLFDDIARDDADLMAAWQTRPWEVRPPGGETLDEVQVRVNAAADDIVARHPGERVGIVTHRVPVILLCMRYRGVPPAGIQSMRIPNAGIVSIDVLGREEGRRQPGRQRHVDAGEPPLL